MTLNPQSLAAAKRAFMSFPGGRHNGGLVSHIILAYLAAEREREGADPRDAEIARLREALERLLARFHFDVTMEGPKPTGRLNVGSFAGVSLTDDIAFARAALEHRT